MPKAQYTTSRSKVPKGFVISGNKIKTGPNKGKYRLKKKVCPTGTVLNKTKTRCIKKKQTSTQSNERLMCKKQKTKKYLNRKSPPYPATACCKNGMNTMRGNDGNLWKTVRRTNKSGTFFCVWQRVSSSTPASSTPAPRPPRTSSSSARRKECLKQNTEKYRKRKSPPYPASACCKAGMTMMLGNDGNTWRAVQRVNKSGTRYCVWQRYYTPID